MSETHMDPRSLPEAKYPSKSLHRHKLKAFS